MHAEFGGSRCNFGSFYFYFVIGTFRPSLALLTCDMAKNSAFLLVCFRIKFFRLLIFGSSAQSHASSLEKKKHWASTRLFLDAFMFCSFFSFLATNSFHL